MYSNLSEKSPQLHVEPTVCLVTAFMDIGRDAWQHYTRTTQEYFTSFMPYLNLDHEIIVFIDDKHLDLLCDIINLDKTAAKITLISINREWMKTNIHAYGKIEMEKKIMESEGYKKLIAHRGTCPECWDPSYNIMQHSKIDFVCYAIENKLSKCNYFAWTDFGYFKNNTMLYDNGKNKLDLSKFNLQKVNFQTINPIDEKDQNTIYTLQHAPEKIGGFFYLGSRELLLEYRNMYHEVNDDFHKMGLVDDDQHFMIKCYFKRRELFHLWDLGGWHRIYTTFCV